MLDVVSPRNGFPNISNIQCQWIFYRKDDFDSTGKWTISAENIGAFQNMIVINALERKHEIIMKALEIPKQETEPRMNNYLKHETVGSSN